MTGQGSCQQLDWGRLTHAGIGDYLEFSIGKSYLGSNSFSSPFSGSPKGPDFCAGC